MVLETEVEIAGREVSLETKEDTKRLLETRRVELSLLLPDGDVDTGVDMGTTVAKLLSGNPEVTGEAQEELRYTE